MLSVVQHVGHSSAGRSRSRCGRRTVELRPATRSAGAVSPARGATQHTSGRGGARGVGRRVGHRCGHRAGRAGGLAGGAACAASSRGAASGVAERQRGGGVGAVVGAHHPYPQSDAASLGVLGGVGVEVEQDAADAGGVAQHRGRRAVAVGRQQCHAALWGGGWGWRVNMSSQVGTPEGNGQAAAHVSQLSGLALALCHQPPLNSATHPTTRHAPPRHSRLCPPWPR